MTIQEVVKRAMDEGWRPKKTTAVLENNIYFYITEPGFWSALGKSMEWPSTIPTKAAELAKSIIDSGVVIPKNNTRIFTEFNAHAVMYGWLHYQHNLIDHIADGGTIESYFETL